MLSESAVTLTANVSKLREDGQAVEVRVQGVTAPMPRDVVAMYAPPTADPQRTVPLAWVELQRGNPGYAKTGAGTVM